MCTNATDDTECIDVEPRTRRALTDRPIPAWVDTDAVDDGLGEHVTDDRQVVADGGVVRRSETRTDGRQRVPVAGGVLVYESCDPVGRELVGFEDVDDWDDLRSALSTRGHAVGAIHHKPVLDGSEDGR